LPAQLDHRAAPANGRVATEQRSLRLEAGRADIAELNRLTRSGARARNEQFDHEVHLDEVIPKPWGYEYRAFVDDYFDFWTLHIDAPHGTSRHVHPRKLTYLICLGGQGITSGLNVELPVSSGTMVRIAPGAFHGTRNTGDEPLELIEIEVPRNKYDLLRLQDDYNRAGTGYETASVDHPDNAMRPVPYLPHTRMRDHTLDGRFRFELRTGMDIYYRRRREDIFYVPLCLSGVVRADVRILTPQDGLKPDTELTYLSISRASMSRAA
jgi:mannose-6-phosphate isomerase-like protein (cupin superfamily)